MDRETSDLTKIWIKNGIAFFVGIATTAIVIGIPLLVYRSKTGQEMSIFFICFYAAPFAGGLACGLLVQKKGRFIVITSFSMILVVIGYIIMITTGIIDWIDPPFVVISGVIALGSTIIVSQVKIRIIEMKQG